MSVSRMFEQVVLVFQLPEGFLRILKHLKEEN